MTERQQPNEYLLLITTITYIQYDQNVVLRTLVALRSSPYTVTPAV